MFIGTIMAAPTEVAGENGLNKRQAGLVGTRGLTHESDDVLLSVDVDVDLGDVSTVINSKRTLNSIMKLIQGLEGIEQVGHRKAYLRWRLSRN